MDKSKHQQVPVSSAIPHSFRCLQSGQREGSRSASVMTSFLRTVGEPSARPSPPRANAALLRGLIVNRERKEGTRTSSDPRASLEASRSKPARLSLRRRMLAGLRARERFGFCRVPTLHCFPAKKGQCVGWSRSRLPLRGSPGFSPGSLFYL